MRLRVFKRLWIFSLFASVGGFSLDASSLAFNGTLNQDDEVKLFFFQVSEASSMVQMKTLGYAGGTTFEGNTLAPGGFDPFLSLFIFPGGGNLVATNDDGPNAAIDPATGQGLDSLIALTLTRGSYLLVLSQYGNYPNGSSMLSGFSQTGSPTFTSNPAFAQGDPCPSSQFKDSTGGAGRCRTGDYYVELSNIVNVSETFVLLDDPHKSTSTSTSGSLTLSNSVPEPNTLATLVLSGGLLLAAKRLWNL